MTSPIPTVSSASSSSAPTDQIPLSIFPPSAFTPPNSSSAPYSTIPLSKNEALQFLHDSTDWVAELCKKPLFKGLPIQVSSENELSNKVATLLALAYETRDLHLAELFTLERQYRREMLILEMMKHTLMDARATIFSDYTDLDDVKVVLNQRGFAEHVRQYTTTRDPPTGCSAPPSDITFVYKSRAEAPPADGPQLVAPV